MSPHRGMGRIHNTAPTPSTLLHHLSVHLADLQRGADVTAVNHARADVLAQCVVTAEQRPGFFSLTVPTGGGKTLSSLAFALTHAVRHNLRRVIYAIPFTSIIEQNAKVFREALSGAGDQVVLEHHSNFDPPNESEVDSEHELQTPWHRLAAENWDSTLVVTTNVQLLESLFASKPSRCRKLHRIARSVIILDECQTLPVTLLAPTLRLLEELVHNYGCTVVLCSATQPAITERPEFRIGLQGVREIIHAPRQLHQSLKRVEVSQLGKLEDSELIERLRGHEQVLCIINTRGHAAKLFTGMKNPDGAPGSVFHLSANMCPEHRTVILDEIRERLNPSDPKPCRVISTQLIEAGVDIDFPVVYRAMTGLDSIAQAAGRCNREGRQQRGQVYLFETDVDPRGELRMRRQVGNEVAGLEQYQDLLGLDAIQRFFELHYWTRKGEWDKQEILDQFRVNNEGLHFQFREAADRFRMIDDMQESIIVPYGKGGKALINELHSSPHSPGRDFARRAQRYVVSQHKHHLDTLCQNGDVNLYHDRYWVLENELNYDRQIGLRMESLGFQPERWIV